MNLIKLLTAEAQSNKDIFNLIDKFFEILIYEIGLKNIFFGN